MSGWRCPLLQFHISSIVVALACAPSLSDNLPNLPGWAFCICEVDIEDLGLPWTFLKQSSGSNDRFRAMVRTPKWSPSNAISFRLHSDDGPITMYRNRSCTTDDAADKTRPSVEMVEDIVMLLGFVQMTRSSSPTA